MAEPTGEHAKTCQHCKHVLVSYFEIKYVDRNGNARPQVVRVCSMKCMLGWAYAYIGAQGARGIAAFRQILARIGQSARGV